MRLLVDLERQTTRSERILVGIHRYAAAHADWELLVPGWDGPLAVLARDADALLLRDSHHRLLADPRFADRAVVITGDRIPWQTVWHDDAAVARLGARHLFELGTRRVLVRDDDQLPSLHFRMGSFASAFAEAGGEVLSWTPGDRFATGYDLELEFALLAEQVTRLAQPFTLVTYDAITARRMLAGLRRIGLEVPEPVSVFSLEDDVLVAEAARPSISSVELSSEALGVLAADTLAQLLATGQRRSVPVLQPRGVNDRGSTVALQAGSDTIRELITAVQAAPAERWDVTMLTERTGLSRRSLERRFREVLGRGPAEEILRLRLELAARRLLADDTAIAEIAATCGFEHPSHFSRAFRRRFGQTPQSYRITAGS